MSPSSRRPPLLALLAVLVGLGLVAAPGPIGAGTTSPFPEPVVAPVFVPDGTPTQLSVTSVAIDTDGPRAVADIRFAEPFGQPDVFRYRVALLVGDPAGEQQRVSLLVDGGVPLGVVEVGDGDEWEATGATAATFDRADGVTVELPAGFAPAADDLAWVEVALAESETGPVDRFVTPLVPAADLFGASGDVVHTAGRAWGSVDEQPPAPAVAVPDPPGARLDGDQLVLAFSGPLPTELGGEGVVNVVDVVRIADGFADGGAAPYLVTVDHGKGTVSLLDGTGVLPVEVATDEDWLVRDLPGTAVLAGTEVVVDLPAVAAAFGLGPGTEGLAVGTARSITLDSGRVVRADGVLATTDWLAAAPDPATTTSTTPADSPGATGGDDDSVLPFVLVGLGIVALGGAAWFGLRWWEHRRHHRMTGPIPESPPPVAAPDEAEQARLDTWTDELFGGGPRP